MNITTNPFYKTNPMKGEFDLIDILENKYYISPVERVQSEIHHNENEFKKLKVSEDFIIYKVSSLNSGFEYLEKWDKKNQKIIEMDWTNEDYGKDVKFLTSKYKKSTGKFSLNHRTISFLKEIGIDVDNFFGKVSVQAKNLFQKLFDKHSDVFKTHKDFESLLNESDETLDSDMSKTFYFAQVKDSKYRINHLKLKIDNNKLEKVLREDSDYRFLRNNNFVKLYVNNSSVRKVVNSLKQNTNLKTILDSFDYTPTFTRQDFTDILITGIVQSNSIIDVKDESKPVLGHKNLKSAKEKIVAWYSYARPGWIYNPPGINQSISIKISPKTIPVSAPANTS